MKGRRPQHFVADEEGLWYLMLVCPGDLKGPGMMMDGVLASSAFWGVPVYSTEDCPCGMTGTS